MHPLYIILVLWSKEAGQENNPCFNVMGTIMYGVSSPTQRYDKTSSAIPPWVFLLPSLLPHLIQTDSCVFTFSVISTSEFNHKLGSHVREKHPPHADVTSNYKWCFSMDCDQKIALHTFQMDSMWNIKGSLCCRKMDPNLLLGFSWQMQLQ